MKRETRFSLQSKNMRNLSNKAKGLPEEKPTCLGWFGTKACLHDQEVVGGWAGEPGSYNISCWWADTCEPMEEPKMKSYIVWFGGIPVEAENHLQAFHLAIEKFKEFPACDYIEQETPDGRKIVVQ